MVSVQFGKSVLGGSDGVALGTVCWNGFIAGRWFCNRRGAAPARVSGTASSPGRVRPWDEAPVVRMRPQGDVSKVSEMFKWLL